MSETKHGRMEVMQVGEPGQDPWWQSVIGGKLDEDGDIIGGKTVGSALDEDTARRLAACWNAMRDLDTVEILNPPETFRTMICAKACSGMPDPEAAVAALVSIVSRLRTGEDIDESEIHTVLALCGKGEGSDVTTSN